MAREYKSLSLEEVLGRYACHDPLHLEIHLERYRFASQCLRGDDAVLDVGCAVGFGTTILAEEAGAVRGLDAHAGVIEYAREHYGRPNVEYVAGDCLDYDCPAQSLDLVTAFEVIEHLEAPERFLEKCVQWLKPGGRLVLSTPNKLVHQLLGIEWEFHEREYGYSELWQLLRQFFDEDRIDIHGQNPNMIDHIKRQTGRFTPYDTPFRRFVRALVPRPVIRTLRQVTPAKPRAVAPDDPTLHQAKTISEENVDLADTFIVVCRTPERGEREA